MLVLLQNAVYHLDEVYKRKMSLYYTIPERLDLSQEASCQYGENKWKMENVEKQHAK